MQWDKEFSNLLHFLHKLMDYPTYCVLGSKLPWSELAFMKALCDPKSGRLPKVDVENIAIKVFGKNFRCLAGDTLMERFYI